MAPPSSSPDHLQETCYRIAQDIMAVQQRTDLSAWLGSKTVQHYLPHEMMLAIWGSPDMNLVHHDMVTPILQEPRNQIGPGHVDTSYSRNLLGAHLGRWIKGGRKPYIQEIDGAGLMVRNAHFYEPEKPSRGMRPALIHGICDKRNNQDYLYVLPGVRPGSEEMAQKTITLLLPYIDTALRQITPLSHQRLSCLVQSHRHHEERSLSEREIEIMDWVKMGKTNPEIADILEISSYTVKNHLHHIFKKLSVYNRVQAISRFEQNHG